MSITARQFVVEGRINEGNRYRLLLGQLQRLVRPLCPKTPDADRAAPTFTATRQTAGKITLKRAMPAAKHIDSATVGRRTMLHGRLSGRLTTQNRGGGAVDDHTFFFNTEPGRGINVDTVQDFSPLRIRLRLGRNRRHLNALAAAAACSNAGTEFLCRKAAAARRETTTSSYDSGHRRSVL